MTSGITHVWLPPPSHSVDAQGKSITKLLAFERFDFVPFVQSVLPDYRCKLKLFDFV
jgi:hypothetical protein